MNVSHNIIKWLWSCITRDKMYSCLSFRKLMKMFRRNKIYYFSHNNIILHLYFKYELSVDVYNNMMDYLFINVVFETN